MEKGGNGIKVLKRELFDAAVEINIEATKAWYSKGPHWDCDCGYCRNFLEVARKKQLPQLILKLLDEFGILPEQANYVCQIYDDNKGHYYQVSYRLAGFILDEKEPTNSFDWGDARCGYESYPYGAPDFPEPHFDIKLFLCLPWVLDESDK